MTGERDEYGRLTDEFERCSEVCLNLYTLMDDAQLAGFSTDLVGQLSNLRLRYLDELDARFPGKGCDLWWITQR
jgi:hypothetical protein